MDSYLVPLDQRSGTLRLQHRTSIPIRRSTRALIYSINRLIVQLHYVN